jgi:hypothetical protein
MVENRTARRISVTAILGGLVALGACHRAADGSNPANGTGSRKPVVATVPATDPAVVDANRKMAAGVPVGASTAPVDVRFDLLSAPVMGQPFEVSIAVLPEATTPVLLVDVRASDGLNIDEPEGPVSIEKVQAGSLSRIGVKLSSAKSGTRVLSVKVTLELPTGAESRDFAFPLIVGTAPAASPAKGRG